MEEILDVYTQEHSEEEPMICMDEAVKQLVRDEVAPLPMAPGKTRCEDYHYDRRDVTPIFLFFDPIRGWRRSSVRPSRTRVDWAHEIRHLLEVDYPNARCVKLVCDNLNTHHIASLYEAFPAEEAHRLARRLKIHHTPRHGSWLNVAEIELSVMARQCLDRRISQAAELTKELAAWDERRNGEKVGVNWRFTTADARVKLKHIYPPH